LWVDEHPFSWLFGCSPNVAGKVEAVIFSVKLQTCGLPHEDVALWGLQGFQLLKKSKPEVNNLFYHFLMEGGHKNWDVSQILRQTHPVPQVET
jgi:hypothetical protein